MWKATKRFFIVQKIYSNFNPRLPCGRRPQNAQAERENNQFQSTPSVWKATADSFDDFEEINNFNPRLPCGRRHYAEFIELPEPEISIHAFRVEGDLDVSTLFCPLGLFQSTPSVWKATTDFSLGSPNWAHFNPRLPCGRRP